MIKCQMPLTNQEKYQLCIVPNIQEVNGLASLLRLLMYTVEVISLLIW